MFDNNTQTVSHRFPIELLFRLSLTLTNWKHFARKVIRLFAGISRQEVENEARAVNKLCKSHHPNIVQVFQVGQLGGSMYFIDMELCDFSLEMYLYGGSMLNMPDWKDIREGAVELSRPHEFITIADQILDGLMFIHGLKEVHRDLSPHNGTNFSLYRLKRSSLFLREPTLENR
jgi:serine/threonine protein kinase